MLSELYELAVKAAYSFENAAAENEANWSGWGEQIIPPGATMMRIKAGQALSALRDAYPDMYNNIKLEDDCND